MNIIAAGLASRLAGNIWDQVFGGSEDASRYKGYGTGTGYNFDLGDKGQRYYQRAMNRGISSNLYSQVQGGADQYNVPQSGYGAQGASIMGRYGAGVNLSPYSGPGAVNDIWNQTKQAGQGQFNSAMLRAKGEMTGGNVPVFSQARNQVYGNVAGNYASQMAGYHAQLIQHANDMIQAGNFEEAKNAMDAARGLQLEGRAAENRQLDAQKMQQAYYTMLMQMAMQSPQGQWQDRPGLWDTGAQAFVKSFGEKSGENIGGGGSNAMMAAKFGERPGG